MKSNLRVSADTAGYMELAGAKKDSDCKLVAVDKGVSSQLGCCNLFDPESKTTKEFRCGTCEYIGMKKSLMPIGRM